MWLYSGDLLDEYNQLIKWTDYVTYAKSYCKNNIDPSTKTSIDSKTFKPKRSNTDETIKQISRAIESYKTAINGNEKYKHFDKVTSYINTHFPQWLK